MAADGKSKRKPMIAWLVERDEFDWVKLSVVISGNSYLRHYFRNALIHCSRTAFFPNAGLLLGATISLFNQARAKSPGVQCFWTLKLWADRLHNGNEYLC